MQIRTRLTLLFTALVAALLAAFAVTIYLTSSEIREEEYFKRLRQQAATKANLLLDTKVPPQVLQLIYKNAPNALFQEEVAIYDTAFHLLYHDAVEIDKVKETRSMIDSINARQELKYYLGDVQVVGFLYQHNGKPYVITAAAKDEYGLSKLASLRNTIMIALLASVILIFFTGHFLARKSLQPVSLLLGKIRKITASRLDLRLDEGNRKDELAALAIAFNEVLDRLEQSFDAQKHFVSNISHELRTPLTAMLTELQLTTAKERSNEAYRESILHAIDDTRKLIRLTNSLLDLAKANYDQTEIALKDLRIDELLLDARAEVLHLQPAYKIDMVLAQEIGKEQDISTRGNEYLLKVAFSNLIENGCKFSGQQQCTIYCSYDDRQIHIRFADKGRGIPAEELVHIFTPFYRGSNRKAAEGNGIGLYLTQKIVELHQGTISVSSQEQAGTTFTISLPHL